MKQRKDMLLKFGALFIFFCSLFYVLLMWTPATFRPLNDYTANMLGFLLQMLGMQVSVQGTLVSAGGFSVKIIDECTAIFVFVLFSSFVLAYPTDYKKKAIGLLFGIPSLFVVNSLRLVVVFISGMWYPSLFEYIHVYLWQTIILILVFISCLAWLRLVVMVTTENKPLTFLVRFIAFSSIPFLVWLYLDKEYVAIITCIAEFLLRLIGYPINLSTDPNMAVYPSTFNLITFTALILATQSIGKSTKIKALITGFTLMVSIEIVHAVYQVLTGLQVQYAPEIMNALKIISQYYLPFGLWLVFAYSDVFKRAGAYTCPICGEEKVGIIEHIKTKHGEKALEREDVRAMLETHKFINVVERLHLLVETANRLRKKLEDMVKKKKER